MEIIGAGTAAFLAGGGGAALAGTALSHRRVLGANERIRLGVIGTGARAQSLMKRLKEIPGTEQVLICDVYQPRLLEAAALLDGRAQQQGDHRAVLDSKEIDAVVIGSPQHWHKQMTLDALAAGKDIFLEKAVSHSIEEGVQMVKAVEASKQVVQTGTQQRSWAHYIQGAELVRSGKLGPAQLRPRLLVHELHPAAPTRSWKPDKLDWKRFTGSARPLPVSWEHYYKWRWFWNFGGGPICELLTHWIDVVHWYTGDHRADAGLHPRRSASSPSSTCPTPRPACSTTRPSRWPSPPTWGARSTTAASNSGAPAAP